MAVIRIAKPALPGLVMPSVSVGDGSAEPRLVPLYCGHPLVWRSVTLQVPVDARTARRIRGVVWLWRAFFALIVFHTVLSVVDFVTFDDWDRSWWPLILRLACMAGMLAVCAVGIGLRYTPAGGSAPGAVTIRHVDPTAAWEWVALNPPGAVLVTDWQDAQFQSVQTP